MTGAPRDPHLEVLRAVAGLGIATSAEEVLLALLGAGSELLFSGSALLIEDGMVTHARPAGLIGSTVEGLGLEDGVAGIADLHIGGSSVGPALCLTVHGHQLAWAGLPEVDGSQVELVAPLLDLGRMALEQVQRLQRRQERVARRLLGSEAMVMALFGATTDPVWALDEDLRLTAFNTAFEEMMEHGFGFSPQLGDTLARLPEPHRTRHERLYQGVLERGSMNTDWTTPDRSRVFSVNLQPIRVGKETVGIAVYCRDVTEARRSAGLLSRAKDEAEQANRAKSAFLAQMSHEIRTPLNAIVGLTELVMGTELSASQRDLLAKVKTNSNALLHLVSGILDFSRIEAGQMEIVAAPMDVAAMVVDTVDTLRHRATQKGLELVVEVEEGFPSRVMGDEHRLRQIVVNLVENALKYTDEGRVAVELGLEGESISLVVSDTGWGIAPEEQLRIFERFHRADGIRQVAGVGLGLAITVELVQRMEGTLEIESEPGDGTAFHLLLPLEVVRWTGEPGGSTVERRRLGRSLRVLVVDDSLDNQAVTVALLARVGHRVTAASSGAEAIEWVNRADFDIVLLDVHMPDLDGLETTRRLRASGHTLPIVAITAHAMSSVAEECRVAGMDGFLTKPVPAATLEEEVLRFCRPPRVMVVDDSGEAVLLLALWLRRAGVDVVEARDLRTAVDLADADFDALLIDHELPDGTGPDVVNALARLECLAPFAAISAHDPVTLSALWPEARQTLSKPLTQVAVLDVVAELLRQRFANDG